MIQQTLWKQSVMFVLSGFPGGFQRLFFFFFSNEQQIKNNLSYFYIHVRHKLMRKFELICEEISNEARSVWSSDVSTKDTLGRLPRFALFHQSRTLQGLCPLQICCRCFEFISSCLQYMDTFTLHDYGSITGPYTKCVLY